MKTIQEVLEEIGKLHHNFKEANDKADQEMKDLGEATAETRGKVDEMTTKMPELMKEMEEIRVKLEAPPAPKVDELDEAQQVHFRTMDKFLRRGKKDMDIFEPEEKRALTEASDVDGAFFAPDEMESSIQMNASNIAVMRPLVNVGSTSRHAVVGGLLSKPLVAWGSENLDIDPQTLEAGASIITIHDLKALYLISNDTLDDAEANIVGELSAAFGRVIAEEEDNVIVAGSGFQRPQGIVSLAAIQANYSPSGVAAALSDSSNNGMDALITAMSALKGGYRAGASWAFNSATMGTIMKLKDDNGQYLWQPTVKEGQPSTLLGKGVALAEGMPDIAANAFPIVFADFNMGYKLKDRSGLTIKRLDERYAEKDQVGFIVKQRMGGMPVLTEAFQCVKIATT